jgi:hypothetical protein
MTDTNLTSIIIGNLYRSPSQVSRMTSVPPLASTLPLITPTGNIYIY